MLQVVSYHVIPSGAFLSSRLTEGQLLQTALAGAPPLAVIVSAPSGNTTCDVHGSLQALA